VHRTPLLVDVRSGTFDAYIRSLAKTGRKNYKHVEKVNADLVFAQVGFDPQQVRRFMDLWEQQEVEGRRRQWAFGIGFVEMLHRRGQLLCFTVSRRDAPHAVLALHFIEKHGDYAYCHPPMYDKDVHIDRSIAKYMWFRLIEWSLANPGLSWLDLGGGDNGSWRDLLLNKDQHEGYKWLYVAEAVKEAPGDAPPYTVKTTLFPYGKALEESGNRQARGWERINQFLLVWIWLHRKRRIKKLVGALTRPRLRRSAA
jgi:hypothetical protein